MNPERKSCGFKNIPILVDGARVIERHMFGGFMITEVGTPRFGTRFNSQLILFGKF